MRYSSTLFGLLAGTASLLVANVASADCWDQLRTMYNTVGSAHIGYYISTYRPSDGVSGNSTASAMHVNNHTPWDLLTAGPPGWGGTFPYYQWYPGGSHLYEGDMGFQVLMDHHVYLWDNALGYVYFGTPTTVTCHTTPDAEVAFIFSDGVNNFDIAIYED